MKSEYAVEITDLNKTYIGNANQPPKEALSNINLNIPTGSFFGLLGPNGAGKSTIINIMAGLVIKSSGDVKVCGYDIEKTRHEISALTSNPHWADLGAVKSGRVYFTDGNQYFNRPGPRLVESLEILAEIFYPEKFQFDLK